MAKAVIETRGVWEGIGRWVQVSHGNEVRFREDYDVRRWNGGEPVGEVLFTIRRGTKAVAWGEARTDAKQGYANTNRTCAILCVDGIDADMDMCRDVIEGYDLNNRGYVVPIDHLESYDGTAESINVVILGEPDRRGPVETAEEPEPEDIVLEEWELHIIIDGEEAVVAGPIQDGRLFTMMQGGMLRAFMEVTREDGTVEVVPAHMGTGLPAEEQEVEESPFEEQEVEERPRRRGGRETPFDEYRLGDPRED